MAKKLIVVIEIRHGDYLVPVGETLDTSKFDKKQLEALYDAGAVRVEGEEDKTENEAEQSAVASSANATPVPAKSTSAPAVKETTNVKGSAK